MDWSLRGCARTGHITYAPSEPALRARLVVDTHSGEAWRCLRCEDYVVGEPQGAGPASGAPTVLRGKALRDATILRLLAAERGLRALLLFVIAYGVLRFKDRQASLKETFDRALPAAKPLADVLHVDLGSSPTVDRIRSVLDSSQHTLGLVVVALIAYGVLQTVEAVGLFLLKRWGEYVAAVGTSVFVPFELREIIDRVTVLRVVGFLVNLAAVAYLVYTKRLFGLRGGAEAFEAERASVSVLEVEAAAAG